MHILDDYTQRIMALNRKARYYEDNVRKLLDDFFLARLNEFELQVDEVLADKPEIKEPKKLCSYKDVQ